MHDVLKYLTTMRRRLQASGECPGGWEIRVTESMFELELGFGVQIRARVERPLTGRLLGRGGSGCDRGFGRSATLEAEFLVVGEKLVGLESRRRRGKEKAKI